MKKKHISGMPHDFACALCVSIFMTIFFLCGCGIDSTSDQQADDTSGTGSFACTLSWPHDDSAQENTPYATRALNCGSAGLDAVVFTFYQNDSLVDRYYFECDAHTGTAKGLPVGDGYRVEITAEDYDGIVLYQGEYGPFEITEGETTPGGVIPMALAGPLAAIVGWWFVDYDWFCDGDDGSMTLILNDDFSFTALQEGFADSFGAWSLEGDDITWTYQNGTEYYGTFYDNFIWMDGYMDDVQGGWGCWEGY